MLLGDLRVLGLGVGVGLGGGVVGSVLVPTRGSRYIVHLLSSRVRVRGRGRGRGRVRV